MQITTINMYLLFEIRHNILIQCHGIYIEVVKLNSMLENIIFLEILAGENFEGFGVQMMHCVKRSLTGHYLSKGFVGLFLAKSLNSKSWPKNNQSWSM